MLCCLHYRQLIWTLEFLKRVTCTRECCKAFCTPSIVTRASNSTRALLVVTWNSLPAGGAELHGDSALFGCVSRQCCLTRQQPRPRFLAPGGWDRCLADNQFKVASKHDALKEEDIKVCFVIGNIVLQVLK